MVVKVANPDNPIVFLDISIEKQYAGRVIIELRKDVVPRTAENFRALCTGEYGMGINGKPLCYKGIKFHKAMTLFMVQGGDIINNDGTSGESIYGPKFSDENFTLKHVEGAVSMVNEGLPDTNASQFFIATVPCNHLDGINVVFGQVLSGLKIIVEIDKCEQNEAKEPLVDCIIQDCGEIASGVNWGIYGVDGSEDRLPQYPEDWDHGVEKLTSDSLMALVEKTNNSGNMFFKRNEMRSASRKYRKVIRYLNWYSDIVVNDDTTCFRNGSNRENVLAKLSEMRNKSILNLAATELKLENLKDVLYLCNEALSFQAKNPKAYFRRAQANLRLNNYDQAIEDLKTASSLKPNDNSIRNELKKAMELREKYQKYLKSAYGNMFG